MTTPEPSTLSEQELKALEEYTWSLVCCVCDGPDPYGNHDDDCQAPFWQKVSRAIAQARAARPSPWQPMSEAPEGELIIAMAKSSTCDYKLVAGKVINGRFISHPGNWQMPAKCWMRPSPPAQDGGRP